MALSADRAVKFYATRELVELPVDDNVVIYKGALVGRNRTTGYARPLSAGDDFLGVAYARADNTLPGHVAGGLRVMLHQDIDVVHALPSVALADVGKDVYASDDETLTLAPAGNSRIGRVVALEGASLARVRCQPALGLSGALENLPIVQLADASATLTLAHVNRTLLIANTAARVLTLPPAASVRAGGTIRIVKTSAAAAAVTIDPNGGETIDGVSVLSTVDGQYDVAHLLCTGSEWIVLSRDIA